MAFVLCSTVASSVGMVDGGNWVHLLFPMSDYDTKREILTSLCEKTHGKDKVKVAARVTDMFANVENC